jgi:hypothetical protein
LDLGRLTLAFWTLGPVGHWSLSALVCSALVSIGSGWCENPFGHRIDKSQLRLQFHQVLRWPPNLISCVRLDCRQVFTMKIIPASDID